MIISDEQRLFIDTALKGKNILVDACIGSGKTTSLQILCKELPPDKKILYLTYNKLLKLEAQSIIRQPNATVNSYHGFANQCLRRIGVRAGVPDLIQTFLKKCPATDRYDVLLIDEYQDIDLELSELLWVVKKSNPQMQIIAVGDMQQKIYDKTTLDAASFIEDFLGSHEKLTFTQCFRLSADYAARLGRIWHKPIVGVNPNCRTERMTAAQVIEFLSRQSPSDILALGRRHGMLNTIQNTLERDYPQIFNKNTVYSSISEADEGAGSTEPDKDSAIFTTYDSSKGLERKILVLCDYTEEYWSNRLNRPMTSGEILRNIFCVAASRGKERIIIVQKPPETELSESSLSAPSQTNWDFKPMMISGMFDFRYKEDVEQCFSLLQTKKIPAADRSVIDIPNADGKIDLSPCIGIYQEAVFFRNHSLDESIRFMLEYLPDRPEAKDLLATGSLEQKVLYLTALETGQERYRTQVDLPFIKKSEEEAIIARLSSRLTREEVVQTKCRLPFADPKDAANSFTASGLADVLKDGVVYELKFVNSLTHEHFLQCACYMVAMNKEKGILWNVRDNTSYEITVPDKKMFLDAVAAAVTKGRFLHYRAPVRTSLCHKTGVKPAPAPAPLTSPEPLEKPARSAPLTSSEPQEKPARSAPLTSPEPLEKPARSAPLTSPEPLEKPAPAEDRRYFAVLDTETNLDNEPVSVGVVIADAETFREVDTAYYFFDPEYKKPGLYDDVLLILERPMSEQCRPRDPAMQKIQTLLQKYRVTEIFAYNASFDQNNLPELASYTWYDIMKIAAYRQHNPKIPHSALCFSTGRLKRGFGVQDIMRLLSGKYDYTETHNALCDALDELEIMKLLRKPLSAYKIAGI